MPKTADKESSYLFTVVLWGLTLAALCGLYWVYSYEMRELEEDLFKKVRQDALDVRDSLVSMNTSIYQGMRTIARLPATRGVDRYATNLDEISRQSLQEIYNNLYSNVRLSELYIVPLGFDPERVDPNTGDPEKPIITFDEYIVGATSVPTNEKTAAGKIPEEMEIFEYRAMKRQLDWFASHVKSDKLIRGLEYPALMSNEVLTCDASIQDTEFVNEENQLGVVYSVPFFDVTGALKGMVSGVILTRVFKALLPPSNFILFNEESGYYLSNDDAGHSPEALKQRIAAAHENYLEHDILDIPVIDQAGSWKLWYGLDEQAVASDEYMAGERFLWRTVGLLGGFIVLGGVAMINLLRVQRRIVQTQNQQLELRVAERTKELEASLADLVVAKNAAEQSSRAKSLFLKNMSHEVRTPLVSILGMADLLAEDEQDPDKLSGLRTITKSGNELLKLLGDLIEYAKTESGSFELQHVEFGLREEIQDICSVYKEQAKKKGIEFTLFLDDELPQRVSGDEVRFRQVLSNLVDNATKFTAKGTIAVHVKPIDAKELQLDGRDRKGCKGAAIQIEVRDSGIGIDKSKQDYIFNAFAQADESYTRRFGGMGVGLAIVKQLVTLMKGTIEMQSEAGEGSVFTIRICFELPDD